MEFHVNYSALLSRCLSICLAFEMKLALVANSKSQNVRYEKLFLLQLQYLPLLLIPIMFRRINLDTRSDQIKSNQIESDSPVKAEQNKTQNNTMKIDSYSQAKKQH